MSSRKAAPAANVAPNETIRRRKTGDLRARWTTHKSGANTSKVLLALPLNLHQEFRSTRAANSEALDQAWTKQTTNSPSRQRKTFMDLGNRIWAAPRRAFCKSQSPRRQTDFRAVSTPSRTSRAILASMIRRTKDSMS